MGILFFERDLLLYLFFFIIVLKPKHLELVCFVVSLGMRSYICSVELELAMVI